MAGGGVPQHVHVARLQAAQQDHVRLRDQGVDQIAQAFLAEGILPGLIDRVRHQADARRNRRLQPFQHAGIAAGRLQRLREATAGFRVERHGQRAEVRVQIHAAHVAPGFGRHAGEERGHRIGAHAFAEHRQQPAGLHIRAGAFAVDGRHFAHGRGQVGGVQRLRQIQKDAAAVQLVRQRDVVLGAGDEDDGFRPAHLDQRRHVDDWVLLAVEIHEQDAGRALGAELPRRVAHAAVLDLGVQLGVLHQIAALAVVEEYDEGVFCHRLRTPKRAS